MPSPSHPRFRNPHSLPRAVSNGAHPSDYAARALWTAIPCDSLEYRRVVPTSGSPTNRALTSKSHPTTSKISSSSTGVPSGRLATPNTRRLGFLSFPKTSWSNSEAPSATFGCSRTSPEVATYTPSRTILVTLSSDPRCCRATARALRAARCAAARPASASYSHSFVFSDRI